MKGKSNPVAKYLRTFNKATVERDRKKDAKKGVSKHKKDIYKEEGDLAKARDNVGSDSCWDGYKATGTKKKDGKLVPDCKKESVDESTDKLISSHVRGDISIKTVRRGASMTSPIFVKVTDKKGTHEMGPYKSTDQAKSAVNKMHPAPKGKKPMKSIDEGSYRVQFYDAKGKADESWKNFDNQASAKKYANQANKTTKVGQYKTFASKGRMESVEGVDESLYGKSVPKDHPTMSKSFKARMAKNDVEQVGEGVNQDRYKRSHGKDAKGEGRWSFTTMRTGTPNEKDVVTATGKLGDVAKIAQRQFKGKDIYVMESTKAYGNTMRKHANDRKKALITKSDTRKLSKLSDLMNRERKLAKKESVEDFDENFATRNKTKEYLSVRGKRGGIARGEKASKKRQEDDAKAAKRKLLNRKLPNGNIQFGEAVTENNDLKATPPKAKATKVGQKAKTSSHIGSKYPDNRWVVKKNTGTSKAYRPLEWVLESAERVDEIRFTAAKTAAGSKYKAKKAQQYRDSSPDKYMPGVVDRKKASDKARKKGVSARPVLNYKRKLPESVEQVDEVVVGSPPAKFVSARDKTAAKNQANKLSQRKTVKGHKFANAKPTREEVEQVDELTQREKDMIADRKAKRMTKSGRTDKKTRLLPKTTTYVRPSKGEDDHIVMQLRRAQDSANFGNGEFDIRVSPVKGAEGVRLKKPQIDKLLNVYDKLDKPEDKRKYRITLLKTLRSMRKKGK